jgi:hypothetical protein
MGRELMQRYYFDVRDEDDLFQDEEGREFQNIEAVHQAAAHCLGDMARDALRNPKREGSRNQRMTIEVRNCNGPVLQAKFTFEVDRAKLWLETREGP